MEQFSKYIYSTLLSVHFTLFYIFRWLFMVKQADSEKAQTIEYW